MYLCDYGHTPPPVSHSDAILKYLTAAYSVPDHWYPRQLLKRARVDEYTAWHHTNTRLHASKVFITEVGGAKEGIVILYPHVINSLILTDQSQLITITSEMKDRNQMHDVM